MSVFHLEGTTTIYWASVYNARRPQSKLKLPAHEYAEYSEKGKVLYLTTLTKSPLSAACIMNMHNMNNTYILCI